MKLVSLYRKTVKKVQEEENKKEHPYEKGNIVIGLYSSRCRMLLRFIISPNLELDDKTDDVLIRQWLDDKAFEKRFNECFVDVPGESYKKLTEDWILL